MDNGVLELGLTLPQLRSIQMVRGEPLSPNLNELLKSPQCPFFAGEKQPIRSKEIPLGQSVVETCSIAEAKYRGELQDLAKGGTTILVAPTGCGKSYAIMEILLSLMGQTTFKAVFVSPTRALAKEIATRSNEISPLVWAYITGSRAGDNESSSSLAEILLANVLAVTATIAQRLISANNMTNVDVVVFDECHARSPEYSLLIATARSRGVNNMVLMSATLPEKDDIKAVLSTDIDPSEIRVIEVNPTPRSSKEFFYFKPPADWREEEIEKRMKSEKERKGIDLDEDEKEQILSEVQQRADPDYRDERTPPFRAVQLTRVISILTAMIEKMKRLEEIGEHSVMVFLDGFNSIKNIEKELLKKYDFNFLDIVIIHSRVKIPSDIISRVQKNRLRIYLSTSAGQVGHTYPGLKYLVDSCLSKNLDDRLPLNVHFLVVEWCDCSTLDQRAGRAGRTCAGEVYYCLTEEMVALLRQRNLTTANINKSFSSADLLPILYELEMASMRNDEVMKTLATAQTLMVDQIQENRFKDAAREGMILNLVQEIIQIPYNREYALTHYGARVRQICAQSGASPRQVRAILAGTVLKCLDKVVKAVAVSEFGMRAVRTIDKKELRDERRDHEFLITLYDRAMEHFNDRNRDPNLFDWDAVEAITESIERTKRAMSLLEFDSDNKWNMNENMPNMIKAALTIVFGDQLVVSTNGGESYSHQSRMCSITSDVKLKNYSRSGRILAVFSHIKKEEGHGLKAILTEVPVGCVALFACTSRTEIVELPMNSSGEIEKAVQFETNTGLVRIKGTKLNWADDLRAARTRIDSVLDSILVTGPQFFEDSNINYIPSCIQAAVRNM